MDTEKHCGMANYFTFTVVVIIDNDLALNQFWRARATYFYDNARCDGASTRKNVATGLLADNIKEWLVNGNPLDKEDSTILHGMYCTLLRGATDQVDYHEIAEHLLESFPEGTGRFKVNECFNGFDVEDTLTGNIHWLSDGVDSVFDENGNALPPGGAEFCEMWAEQFNADIGGTLKAVILHDEDEERMNEDDYIIDAAQVVFPGKAMSLEEDALGRLLHVIGDRAYRVHDLGHEYRFEPEEQVVDLKFLAGDPCPECDEKLKLWNKGSKLICPGCGIKYDISQDDGKPIED